MTSLVQLVESTDETLFFEVTSFTDSSVKYDVWYDIDHHWLCTCPQYYYRKKYCKHMAACAELLGIKDTNVYAKVKS